MAKSRSILGNNAGAVGNQPAFIPTLSAAEKQSNHHHRNINRRVSRSVFITTVTA